MWLPKLNSIVRLIEIAEAGDQFGFVVALESGAGNDVEDAIGAISEFGAIAAAIDLHVVDVLGIELRTKVGSDVGVGDGYAIDEPAGLVSAANVELIVSLVGAGHVVGDHGQAVGAVGAGRAFDLRAID